VSPWIWSCWQTHFWRLTRADCATARTILEQAVMAHPDYGPARSLLGFCLVFTAHMGWIAREEGLPRGREHAVRAIALDDRDPWGHIALGYCSMMERCTQESVAAFQRAVSLNPNSAAAHSYLCHGLGFAGLDREAIEHGEAAVRLSPLDPEMARFLGGIAVAHYTAGRFDEAANYTGEALRLRPGFQGAQRLHCASLAQSGPDRRGEVLPRDRKARAAADFACLDSFKRSLSEARIDGAFSGRHEKGRTELGPHSFTSICCQR
jgi:tetratricopeptide (TPR) repeat protein